MRISLARSVSNRLGGFRRRLARRSRLTHGDRSARVSTAIERPAPKGLAQLKLGPASTIVSPRADGLLKAETNCYLTHVSVDAKNHFHIGEEPTEAWIPQRFAEQRLLTPFFAFLSGIRALVAGLLLVALVPNLTLAAILWLGVIDAPWSRPSTHPSNQGSMPGAQSAVPSPVLSSPAVLEATAGANITFPIALDGTDGVPVRSIIAIRGLPQGSKLSSGRPYDETEWNLKPDEIGDLHLALTGNESSEANVIIQLVAPDGAIIADAATVLKVTTGSNVKAELAQPQVRDVQTEGLGAIGGEDKVANVDAATVSGNSVPLPSRRPEPTANDDGSDWIKALAFVNLRQRPTRSAPAISVVAKGAKLRVMGRKKGWLQVSNPATSERGWIYAANIAAVR
jgi:SH3 domain-containing protein